MLHYRQCLFIFLTLVTSRSVQADLSNFCIETAYKGGASLQFGLGESDALNLMKDPSVLADGTKYRNQGPWLIGTFPAEWTGMFAYENFAKGPGGVGSPTMMPVLGDYSSTQAARALLSQGKPSLTAQEITIINSSIKLTLATATENSALNEISANTSSLVALCSELSLKSSLQCASGIQKIREIMSVKVSSASGMNLNLVPVLTDILTKPEYQDGIRIAALKLMNRVESKTPPPVSANLFEDIYSSFIEAGISKLAANDMTWNVLAAVSTGGANTSIRLRAFGPVTANPVAKVGLAIIAASLPVLDFRSLSNGQVYSFPPAVRSTCNLGKPYHFWMTAYLARRMSKELSDTKAASIAAFTTQKGYEFTAAVGGRKPAWPFYHKSRDSFTDIIRIDLAYSSAGAIFGVQSQYGLSNNRLNLDGAISNIISLAGEHTPKSESDANAFISNRLEAYAAWSMLISPNSPFKYLASELTDQ